MKPTVEDIRKEIIARRKSTKKWAKANEEHGLTIAAECCYSVIKAYDSLLEFIKTEKAQ